VSRASVFAVAALATGAAALFAGAEFWQTKPYTEWNDKEVARILNDSPWAREAHAAQFDYDLKFEKERSNIGSCSLQMSSAKITTGKREHHALNPRYPKVDAPVLTIHLL
jgi:hypothetical protein